MSADAGKKPYDLLPFPQQGHVDDVLAWARRRRLSEVVVVGVGEDGNEVVLCACNDDRRGMETHRANWLLDRAKLWFLGLVE